MNDAGGTGAVLISDQQQSTLLQTLLARAAQEKYDPPADMRPIDERRRETRVEASLVAVAELFKGSPVAAGVTVDISVGGMCLRMLGPPTAPFHDITVFDVDDTARVWVQVVGHREAPNDHHIWHVQVLAAVDQWRALVERRAQSVPA